MDKHTAAWSCEPFQRETKGNRALGEFHTDIHTYNFRETISPQRRRNRFTIYQPTHSTANIEFETIWRSFIDHVLTIKVLK